MRSRIFTVVVLMALYACSAPKRGKVEYGVTTVAQLKAELGGPVGEQPATENQPQQVLLYPENQKFQIEGKVVTAGFRDPTEEERALLYWRHRFRNEETTFTAVSSAGASTHLAPEMQLRCLSQGITIIYDPNQDAVTRVVEHVRQSP